MRLLCFVLSLFLMTSIALAAGSNNKKTLKAQCLKSGGSWASWSKYEASKNRQSCRYKAKDAGKDCQDGKECSVGLCEYDPQTQQGRCSQYNGRQGCHQWMVNGQPEPQMCVD